jgi:hypothetical protein
MADKTRNRRPKTRQQLFAWERQHAFPPANRTRTSIAAATAIAEQAPTLRGRVYEFIARRGDAGATREEIAQHVCDDRGTPLKLQTVCGRVAELLELGLVHRTDQTRPTAAGIAAAVVRAVRH